MSEVAITGIGVLHPHGCDVASLERALEAGAPPAGPTITDFQYKVHFPESSKRIKKMDMVGKYASCAALFALRDAGFQAPPDPERAGLTTGTMYGGLEACASFHHDLVTRGPDNVNPVHFPNTAHNVPCGHVAITLGLKGPLAALVSGLVAGHEAIITAHRMVRSGRADLVLAGGFDRWCPALARAAAALGVAVQPAEGACFLVLEARHHAEARGARILGRLLGHGQASDSPALCGVDRSGTGLGRALELALKRAGVARPVALCVGRQGNPVYDQALEAAYARVLDLPPRDLPRLEPKRVLGETFGADGTFAVAATLLRQRAGALPPGPVLVDGYAWGGAAAGLVVEAA